METKLPETLIDVMRYYSSPDVCRNLLVSIRWPDGVKCPRCGCDRVTFMESVQRWNCKGCRKQFSVKVGTIFEESLIGLDIWFAAIWLLSNAKNGVASTELARSLGISQKTAWFVLHRIRKAMERGSFEKLDGTVECDESYVGGKSKNMHNDRRKAMREKGFPKNCVFGLKERDGEVRTMVIPNAQKETLREVITENVETDAQLFTDSATGYSGLSEFYDHRTVDHNKGEYVRIEDSGKTCVYTNGIENYWSLLDRCTYGTYIHWSDQHIHRYLAEEDFRYNTRKQKDGERFIETLQGTVGKRLMRGELYTSHLQNLAPI